MTASICLHGAVNRSLSLCYIHLQPGSRSFDHPHKGGGGGIVAVHETIIQASSLGCKGFSAQIILEDTN